MQVEIPHLTSYVTDSVCIHFLIMMTNEYIDYRNQIFDSTCNQRTKEIENEEDFHYVSEMDRKINEIIDYLES